MSNNTIIFIDHDVAFLKWLESLLDEHNLKTDYNLIFIETALPSKEQLIKYCIDRIKELLTKDHEIEAILLDIAIFHRLESPLDKTGLMIAEQLHNLLPNTPIIAMTMYTNELIMEISMNLYIHGIIPKPFFQSQYFSKKYFNKLINQCQSKTKYSVQKPFISESLSFNTLTQRFSSQDDPRCQYQIYEIGLDNFIGLLHNLFPSGQGTVKFLRPGFSGSYLFKVSVRTSDGVLSTSVPKIWAVKISDDIIKLGQELEKYSALKNRLHKNLYPNLFKEEITTFKKWCAIAFEMQEDAITFSEYLLLNHPIDEITRLVNSFLTPFLQQQYGDPIKDQCFLWKKYYHLDERAKAGILNFIEDIQSIPNILDKTEIERIRYFVNSDGKNEPSISDLDLNVVTYLIHGDLNSRNILVTENMSKMVFIDFANSSQSHYMKDISKLESDLIFLLMDSRYLNHTRWERIDIWQNIFVLYKKDNIFNITTREFQVEDEIKKTMQIIQIFRNVLKSFVNHPEEKQYLIALLYYTLKLLSYPDVSIQKKVFAIKYINMILTEISSK
jgi:hypothetical protein